MNKGIIFTGICLFMIACRGEPRKQADSQPVFFRSISEKEIPEDTLQVDAGRYPADTETEKRLRRAGLVEVREVDPSLQVDLMYARADNFTGSILYTDIHKAFLLPAAAEKLRQAQQQLKTYNPSWSLIVYDAARPMSAQRKMWSLVKGTENRIYVSNPANGGGLHNYGAAVDVSIVDSAGQPLPMGSPVDFFGAAARPDQEARLLKQGQLTFQEIYHRRLLRKVMVKAGFRALPTEWWHFNLMSRKEARENYTALE